MKFLKIVRTVFGIIFMVPILIMIVLLILSLFGVDDGGYLTTFSSWFFAGIFASGGIKLLSWEEKSAD